MNWDIFWPLLFASSFITLLSENPDGRGEIILIVLNWTAVSFLVAFAVPQEYTSIGLLAALAPVLGSVPLKVYRHIQLKKIYGTLTE